MSHCDDLNFVNFDEEVDDVIEPSHYGEPQFEIVRSKLTLSEASRARLDLSKRCIDRLPEFPA
jgi:hypothetical protein